MSIDALSPITEETSIITTTPHWRIVAFAGAVHVIRYDGCDYTAARLAMADVLMSADATGMDVYRNGRLRLHLVFDEPIHMEEPRDDA